MGCEARTELFFIIFLLWTISILAETQQTTQQVANTNLFFSNATRRLTTSQSPTTENPTSTVVKVNTTTTEFPSVTPVTRIIGELKGLSHGISSGKIMIVGDNSLYIPNFHFDGTAPNAQFLVGKGLNISGNGTFVPIRGISRPLEKYTGQNIHLTLPNDLTVKDVDWLAVWCIVYRQNLGYVFLNKKVSPYPPQTFNLKNIVTSGPIILVDKKTLFVPNFVYKGDHPNVRFWVGNGTEPSSAGTAIPDERGSIGNLHAYHEKNFYLNLPRGINTDNIEYFGVWSLDEQLNLGHVAIKGITGVPEPSEDRKDKILRLPKCCPVDSILTANGCEERPSVEFEPKFSVLEHNDTHFNNESLDLNMFKFEPYYFAPKCSDGKLPLDESQEEFFLLRNGSLLVKGLVANGVLSQQSFCLETIDDEMQILICAHESKIQYAMFYAYITLTVVSTFCFAATFFLYFFWFTIEDVHRKCFTGYVFAMFVAFLSLTIVQTTNVENGGCGFLGFLFQIAMIAAFNMLAILCCDIYVIVRFIDEHKYTKERKRWYLGVAIVVPLVFLIISLVRNVTPDVPNSFFKPQYQKNRCYFEEESQRSVLFYLPITVCIIVSAVMLVLTILRIRRNDIERIYNYYWIEKKTTFKFMWRTHLILLLTGVIWTIESVLHLLVANTSMLMAIDVVEASQGIFIMLLFVFDKDTRHKFVKTINACRNKKTEIKFTSEDEQNEQMLKQFGV